MAEVKMDLAELKQLESKIEVLEKEKQELLDNQHQVVVYHKYFTGKIKPGKMKNGAVNSVAISGMQNYGRMDYFKHDINLDYALEQGLIEIDIKEDTSKISKDYLNMSDVISTLREELKMEYDNSLLSAQNRATTAEYTSSVIEDKYKKEILSINDKNKSVINKLKDSYEILLTEKAEEFKAFKNKSKEEYSTLQKEFDDFKTNKEMVSLEDQILALKQEIVILKNRPFIKRLFNL